MPLLRLLLLCTVAGCYVGFGFTLLLIVSMPFFCEPSYACLRWCKVFESVKVVSKLFVQLAPARA